MSINHDKKEVIIGVSIYIAACVATVLFFMYIVAPAVWGVECSLDKTDCAFYEHDSGAIEDPHAYDN